MTTIAPLAAFLGGTLTLLAPCSVMLLPAFFAYAFTSRRTLLVRTGIFWCGLITVLIPLGVASGTLGALLKNHSALIVGIGAVIIIVLGILQLLAVDIPLPWKGQRTRGQSDSARPLSIYLLGVTYSISGVGCAGPILGAVLITASFSGEPLRAGVLMLLYATGMALPLALLALAWMGFGLSQKAWLRPRPVRFLGRDTTWTNVISGTLFIVLGLGMLLFDPSNPFGAIISSERLAAWEEEILFFAEGIPSWFVLLVLIAVGIGGALVWIARRNSRSHASETDGDGSSSTQQDT